MPNPQCLNPQIIHGKAEHRGGVVRRSSPIAAGVTAPQTSMRAFLCGVYVSRPVRACRVAYAAAAPKNLCCGSFPAAFTDVDISFDSRLRRAPSISPHVPCEAQLYGNTLRISRATVVPISEQCLKHALEKCRPRLGRPWSVRRPWRAAGQPAAVPEAIADSVSAAGLIPMLSIQAMPCLYLAHCRLLYTRKLMRAMPFCACRTSSSVSLGSNAISNAKSLSMGPGGKLVTAGLGAAALAGVGYAMVPKTMDVNHRLMGESHYLETVKHVTGSSTVRPLLTTDELLSDSSPMGKDHLFTNLLKNNMVTDIHCFFDVEQRKFHSLVRLSSDVCGHPTIVHGGLTAAIMDEAFGGLAFCMKKWKLLGPGPPFTVKVCPSCPHVARLPKPCGRMAIIVTFDAQKNQI